jgi:N-acetylglutamate synthase-like GNAT family acetyltransferase
MNTLSFHLLPNDQKIIDTVTNWNETHWREALPDLKEYVAFADFYKQVLETPEDQLPQAFIAKLNNELVATIALTEEEGEVLQPWVSNLYVDPTHRKNGIGGFLMEMIIDVAKVRGFKEVYGWTNSEQEEFYYRKRGWEVIETRENDVVIIKKSTL